MGVTIAFQRVVSITVARAFAIKLTLVSSVCLTSGRKRYTERTTHACIRNPQEPSPRHFRTACLAFAISSILTLSNVSHETPLCSGWPPLLDPTTAGLAVVSGPGRRCRSVVHRSTSSAWARLTLTGSQRWPIIFESCMTYFAR